MSPQTNIAISFADEHTGSDGCFPRVKPIASDYAALDIVEGILRIPVLACNSVRSFFLSKNTKFPEVGFIIKIANRFRFTAGNGLFDALADMNCCFFLGAEAFTFCPPVNGGFA